jgi:hypothetical protein
VQVREALGGGVRGQYRIADVSVAAQPQPPPSLSTAGAKVPSRGDTDDDWQQSKAARGGRPGMGVAIIEVRQRVCEKGVCVALSQHAVGWL